MKPKFFKISYDKKKIYPAPRFFIVGGKLVTATDEELLRRRYVRLEDTEKPEISDGYDLKTTYTYVYDDKQKKKPEWLRTPIAIKPVYELVKNCEV